MPRLPLLSMFLAAQISVALPVCASEKDSELDKNIDMGKQALEDGNYYRAERLWLRVQSALAKLSSPDQRVADMLQQLGLCYFKQSKYTQAEDAYKQSADVLKSLNLSTSPADDRLSELSSVYKIIDLDRIDPDASVFAKQVGAVAAKAMNKNEVHHIDIDLKNKYQQGVKDLLDSSPLATSGLSEANMNAAVATASIVNGTEFPTRKDAASTVGTASGSDIGAAFVNGSSNGSGSTIGSETATTAGTVTTGTRPATGNGTETADSSGAGTSSGPSASTGTASSTSGTSTSNLAPTPASSLAVPPNAPPLKQIRLDKKIAFDISREQDGNKMRIANIQGISLDVGLWVKVKEFVLSLNDQNTPVAEVTAGAFGVDKKVKMDLPEGLYRKFKKSLTTFDPFSQPAFASPAQNPDTQKSSSLPNQNAGTLTNPAQDLKVAPPSQSESAASTSDNRRAN